MRAIVVEHAGPPEVLEISDVPRPQPRVGWVLIQADHITREAYSHEEISCGFWPGNDTFPTPAFYLYTSPAPPGLSTAAIRPPEAYYSQELGEFILRYDDLRASSSPEQALLEFLQSTYEAGATLAQWDRESLERKSHSAGSAT